MSEDENKETYNLNSEDDRKKLRRKVGTDINITLDDENAKKETEELKSEVEDLKGKLAIVAERALEQKMDKLGIPENDRSTFRQNPELLRGYELGISQGSDTRQAPTGSAPLNDGQLYGSQNQKGYGSISEMLDDLYLREKNGDKTATAILSKLVLKTARGVIRGQQQGSFEKPEPENDALIIDKSVENAIEDENESELLKLGVKKKTPKHKMRKVDREGNPK